MSIKGSSISSNFHEGFRVRFGLFAGGAGGVMDCAGGVMLGDVLGAGVCAGAWADDGGGVALLGVGCGRVPAFGGGYFAASTRDSRLIVAR